MLIGMQRRALEEVIMMCKAYLMKLSWIAAVCLTVLVGCRTTDPCCRNLPDQEEPVKSELTEDEKKIKAMRERLEKIMVPPLRLRDAPLSKVIKNLALMTGITLVIDETLPTDGITLTFSTIDEMPLLDLLEIAFAPIDFGYEIKQDRVWIAHRSKLKNKFITRYHKLIYPYLPSP